MKERELDNIHVSEWGVNPIKEDAKKIVKSVHAFDTEWWKGKAVLMGVYGDNDYRNHILPKSLDDILEFLTRKRFCKSYNWWFNTKADRDALFKWMSAKQLTQLKNYGMVNHNGFLIELISNKTFTIKKLKFKNGEYITKRKAFFTDVYPFYQIGSLEKTVKEGLGIEYKKALDIGSGVPQHKITDEIIDYCIEDSKYTYLLAKNITDLTGEVVDVRNFYSPASISKQFIRTKMDAPYKFMKSRIQQMALYSYNGGRFECLKRGGWMERPLYMADINSAYPFQISELFFPEGDIKKTLEYEPDSLYSYFKVDISVPDEFILSPFKHVLKIPNELLVFPTGFFKDVYINKGEYEILERVGCEIKVKEGVHMFNREPRLWLDGIAEIFYKRKELKEIGDSRQLLLKLILNCIYGSTIQLSHCNKYDKNFTKKEELDASNDFINHKGVRTIVRKYWSAGQFFNPIMACEITAGVRNKLFNDFHKHEKDVVMLATDAVVLTKPFPYKSSKDFGEYDVYDRCFGVVLGNGIYQFDNGKMGRRGLMSDEPIDFFELFDGHLDDTISLTKHRPKSFREGMPSHMETDPNFDYTNIFLPYTRDLVANMDRKRTWSRDFRNFDEVLDLRMGSEPLTISN